MLPDEIQTANSFLNKLVKANPKLAGMGTTITSLLITQDRLQFAHIGDSRAYRLQSGDASGRCPRTTPSSSAWSTRGGWDPDQAEYHPHKNVLMRVLGDVDASPELDITFLPAGNQRALAALLRRAQRRGRARGGTHGPGDPGPDANARSLLDGPDPWRRARRTT